MKKIKLIIVDYHGVFTIGSYKETCQWLSRKYGLNYDYLYDVVYNKYFSQAALGKITDRESFELAVKELGLKENWRELRNIHVSFWKLNPRVEKYLRKLQEESYIILLLSKNTPEQFNEILRKFKTRKYFKNMINTYDLKLPKADKKTIKLVLKKFKIKPGEAIMIDDQKINLIEAKRLGVKTIYYKSFLQFKREIEKYLK